MKVEENNKKKKKKRKSRPQSALTPVPIGGEVEVTTTVRSKGGQLPVQVCIIIISAKSKQYQKKKIDDIPC